MVCVSTLGVEGDVINPNKVGVWLISNKDNGLYKTVTDHFGDSS